MSMDELQMHEQLHLNTELAAEAFMARQAAIDSKDHHAAEEHEMIADYYQERIVDMLVALGVTVH